ncbi:hypothetical protein, partial [Glutamicibacter sp. V16R2B1]|uniref:hypothetical protein n=1 Tax=Glutamicibacter sp. V16R2B1 TaxID=2036207 RepID=UPI001BB1B35A
ETARAVAGSGIAYYSASGAASWTVPAALSPGVYHPYVRAADAGSGGRWSDWASSTFTIVGDPPAPPALLSVTPDPARGRVEIRARQTDNLLNQQTATGDGVANEYLRWHVYGNVTTPTATSGGLTGNCVTASVIANGEAAITGVQLLRVIPGLTHIWAGWIKADVPGGAMHLDIAWFDAAKSFIRMDEGGVVGLGTSYEASEGRGEAPDNATWAHLMWRSSGPLAAGQDLFWDDCGVWFTRTDPLLGDLEARLIAAEDAVVDLEIRVAELEGVPPVISIHPTRAPIDATAYRGGLDSGNLLGPADASFIYTLAGTHWTLTGPGSLATAPDEDAYEGYSLRVLPGSTGTGRRLTLTSLPLPPQVGASYQFSFRHRAIGDGLRATATLTMLDGNDAAVGAVSVGVVLDETPEFSDQVAVTIVKPDGATRFSLDLYLDGESSTDDRWIFDQFQVARLPLVASPQGFGVGPFGFGPFGGTISGQAGRAPTLAWKPASQVDVYPLVEWSTDDGDTWTPVRHTDRAAYDPVTRTALVYDYEAPIGKPVMYRVRTVARDFQTDPVAGALLVSAPTTTRVVTLDVDGYWILDPYTQKRLPFNIAASSGAPELRMTRPIPRGEFSPYGADYKVLVYDRAKGNEFDWRIALESHAAWDEFDALLASGHTLLVQTPIGKSWYIRPSDWKPTVPLEGVRDMGAVIEFSGYEQPRPV